MSAILILFTLPAACGEDASKADAPSNQFTVAAYNMNWGNVDLSNTVEVIRGCGADVVCMQETNSESEEYIRRRLAEIYPHMVFRGGGRGSDGFAILSKTPLANVRMIPAKHAFFGTLMGEAVLGGTCVQIASIHLEPVVPRNNEEMLGLIGVFARSEQVRAREIAYIHSKLRKNLPVIIAGDYNSISFGAAPRFLAQRGFADSFASVTKDADRHVTWRWRYKGVLYRFRIDYIFHSSHFATRSSRIIKSKSSDHDMVVSVLTPAPKRKGKADEEPVE